MLELEGACVSCQVQEVTVKMGLEKRLMQTIPQIDQVLVLQNGLPIEFTREGVEEVLDGIREILSGYPLTIEEFESEPPKLTLSLSGGAGPI